MHFGEAESVSEARTALESDIPWDLSLLDIGLQKENGLTAERICPDRISKVLGRHPFPCPRVGVKAMQLRRYGYVSKTDPPDQIILAIKQVLAGKKHITDSMATQLVAEIGRPQPQDLPHERLSRRELIQLDEADRPREVTEERSM